ncbi:uncharacterized protein LOC112343672 [Selaginella moellendorffii]|uniref:uncharacterized protein LOC112343672 n=1 Tax=Selaginella moellendorffii TaxID=88036 RepID=UPI000D1C5CD2|nr:uncharacterized protein LOC112343672 [Selaginella moellendorffii]|eukprot:XP_024523301.1 uncharacterized protein LOC112343672 [Selaginella moellendorffii]
MSNSKQAQVIYYLCRKGSLEQPHLIDVGFTQENELLLSDVKRSLVAIRGRGMPDLFSWSYKTKYKNDFIWHDVSDNDVVLPMNDADYILKGSEIVDGECEHCPHDSDSEIQCKLMLKEHACLAKSPVHRAFPLEECVIQTTNHPTADTSARNSNELKLCKQRSNLDHGNSITTQTDDEELPVRAPKHECCQCRGEKPLPNPPPLVSSKEVPPASCADKTPQRKAITVFGGIESGFKDDSGRTKKVGGSSLIFRQMLPCADIGTRAQQNGFTGQKQDLAAVSKENGSWKQSCKVWKKNGGRLSPLLDRGTKIVSDGRHSYDSKQHSLLPGTPTSKYQDFQSQRYSTLTRYRPRHSFSNSDYFDSYDLFTRPEKVKEVDARPSNASRISLESLYEVDCKAKTFDCVVDQQARGSPAAGKCGDDNSIPSVGNHIISKLVLEAKANEEKDKVWWEGIRSTPRRENRANDERMRKNKLDWEKNLQDAVNMIIRPPQ